MPSTLSKSKRANGKRPSVSAKRISNARLLKLAAKHRPPQAWYDDTSDPSKPAPSRRR